MVIFDQTIEKVTVITWARGVIAMGLEGGLFVWDPQTGAIVSMQSRGFAVGLVKRCEAFHGCPFDHKTAKDGVESWTKP